MKAVAIAIVIALGIALVVTMGPAPASAQTTVVRECGDHYVVTRYNSNGSVKGVHNKQLSDEGTIYTGGKTWLLVEGTEGNPDRFVSDGEVLQVSPCDATRGVEVRQFQPQVPGTQRQVQGTQTSTTLVSNTEQTPTNTPIQFNGDNAQAFTTGSHAFGYKLTGVDLRLRVDFLEFQPQYTVSIHKNSSGVPGDELGAVTGTSSLTTSWTILRFTASGDGLDLAPNRAYWVVIDSHEEQPSAHIAVTNSLTEDSGAAAEWSIADTRQHRDFDGTTWDPDDQGSAIQIAIKGYANPLPDNFDCNTYLGWEHTNGRQWDSADRVWRQVGSYFFTGQYANTLEPICERRFSSVGPGTYADKLGYGMTLCSQAPTWQTIDPKTGEAVGGPARVHKTGHLTSSGQEICSDFDGLRSTKKYIQEQQLKQLCSREPTHALCN